MSLLSNINIFQTQLARTRLPSGARSSTPVPRIVWRKMSAPASIRSRCVCRARPSKRRSMCLPTRYIENHIKKKKNSELILFSVSVQVETEGKPMTNQKSSGRCWLFAALNCIRIPFCKQFNLEEFEFSQSYLFFWDKIERCHFFLNNIVETAQRGEEVTGRLVSFLLSVSGRHFRFCLEDYNSVFDFFFEL